MSNNDDELRKKSQEWFKKQDKLVNRFILLIIIIYGAFSLKIYLNSNPSIMVYINDYIYQR